MPQRNKFSVVLAAHLAIGLAGTSIGQELDFTADIAPILEKKCLGCHNPNILKGDFSMATLEDIRLAGEDMLIPGNSEDSMLHWITLPSGPDEPPDMPEDGEPLTSEEADLLAAWIDAGADWPDGLVLKEASKADKSWWAYQPIGAPKHDSIDAYIQDRLSEEGLGMNQEADRRTLIRRATYDLIGLPPTPEEVAAFVNDTDPNAYGRLIDRLLASPHYGERWGRHWLDVVRFGESVGFEQNWIIKDLWPFRDYVIDSLNEDKPFDVFIREHLAGDVIANGDPEIEIGSAFLVAGPYDTVNNQDAVQAAQIRANTLDEIINASGEAFLGMTLSCARCHDHKFDPISQADYYRAYATFSGVRHGSVPWATPEQKRARSQKLKPLNEEKSRLESDLEALRTKVLERSGENLAQFEANWVRPPVDRTGTEDRFEPVLAKRVRLVCESMDLNPESNTGFRIDEFEIWSTEDQPRNVALSSNGGVASGKAREIEDFPNAYGVQHTNDGEIGFRFIATSDYLEIELVEPTEIDRVFFSSAQGEEAPDLFKFSFVADYRIEVSMDGEEWSEVAHGRDRQPIGKKPLNPARNDENTNLSHLEHRLLSLGITEAESARQAELKRELAKVKREINSVPDLPTAWVGKRSEEDGKGPFSIFVGGDPQKQGSQVTPASLSTLSESLPGYQLPENAPESERRLAYAQWITSSDNPLTPRVLANRLWHYHFGTGIVDTPNDFGYMGGRPTHPELLDFLASELIENDWRIKPLHRMIMQSDAYRQSSEWRPDGAEIDSDSRLLWRFPPRRLSAEEIRDTLLVMSDKLDTEPGGPGFRLYYYMRDNVSTYEPLDQFDPETYRRSVYHQNARASVVDLMTDFDQADCTLSQPRRSQTTTPLQALTMMNHSFTLDMATALADRARSKAGDELVKQVEAVFELAYQRLPGNEERTRSLEAGQEHGLEALCRAIINSSELIYLD